MALKKKRPNPAYAEYLKQLEHLNGLIDKFNNTPSMHGQKWIDSQVKYYTGKLNELKENKPERYLTD